MAAREDVPPDEVGAPAVGVVALVRDGDGLQRHDASGCQQKRSRAAQNGPEVVVPDRFEHLDGDDAIKPALNVTPVLDPDLDPIGEAGGGDPRAGVPRLCIRQCQPGDTAAVQVCRQLGKGAPATADLEAHGARGGGGPGRRRPGAWRAAPLSRPWPGCSKIADE